MPQISKYKAAGKAAGKYKSRLSDVATAEYAKEHEKWKAGRTQSMIGQVGASVANIIGIIGERKKASEFAKYKDIAAELPGVVAEEEEYKTLLGRTKTRTTYKSAISGREIPESVLSAIGYQESFAPGTSDYGDYQKVLEEGAIYSPTAAKMATEATYEAAGVTTQEEYEEKMGMGEFTEEELPFNLTKEEEALEIDIKQQESLDVKLEQITRGVVGDSREAIRAEAEADLLAHQVSAQRDPTPEERELLKGKTDRFIKQHERAQTYEAAFIEGAAETEADILESDEDKERKRIASLQEAALSKHQDVSKKVDVSGYLKMPGEEGAKWFPGKLIIGGIGALGVGLYKSLFKGEDPDEKDLKEFEMDQMLKMGMITPASGVGQAGAKKYRDKVAKRDDLAKKAAATKAAKDKAAADKAASELETFTEESYLDWLDESFPNIDWKGIEEQRLASAELEDTRMEQLETQAGSGEIDTQQAFRRASAAARAEVHPQLEAISKATSVDDLEEYLQSDDENVSFAAQMKKRELDEVETRRQENIAFESLTPDEQGIFEADVMEYVGPVIGPEYKYVEGNKQTEGSKEWFDAQLRFFKRRKGDPFFGSFGGKSKYNRQLEFLAREAGWTGSSWE